VNLRPGTGDVPLSLAQSIVVEGAVVVTTAQRLAVLEAIKAVEMFRKLDVPVPGAVENTSFATCALWPPVVPVRQWRRRPTAREDGVRDSRYAVR
jgi:Mrp family chromosome partitioning ATPase